ncbi:MAG TPA: HPF/RaiA family ribosome-associated protein [Chitinophagaceae bacterium]|nr:HPF/RaiA family ribosome-associated protein [Chitinophagaceae bacterium]
MEIIIQSLGFTASNALESYSREKLEKLDKEARIIRANVTLFLGSDSNPNKYYCEIRLEVPGKDHFVKKNGHSFETAIIDAVNTLQLTMRKAKEKQMDRNQGNAS